MKKKQMLIHWKGLPENQAVSPQAVAYKHEGTTYDEDGIRITGSQAWIDSVLSRLKGMLEYENGSTRLQVVYKPSTDRHTGAEMWCTNRAPIGIRGPKWTRGIVISRSMNGAGKHG